MIHRSERGYPNSTATMYQEYAFLIERYPAYLLASAANKWLQFKTEYMAAPTSVFLLFTLAITEASIYVAGQKVTCRGSATHLVTFYRGPISS